MARELKLIPHDDGMLTLLDDPTWRREYPGLQGRRIVAMLAIIFLTMALVTVGLSAVGLVWDMGATIGFMVGAVLSFPFSLVQPRASWALHIGQVGLTVSRVFGRVRTGEVMDGVANTKPARIGSKMPPRQILWEDVESVVWSDVHLDLRHGGGQLLRFDLEDYARDDIARLGEEIRAIWERTEPSRDAPEQGEASKEQLQRLARRQTEG